jgi:hypothetical protein
VPGDSTSDDRIGHLERGTRHLLAAVEQHVRLDELVVGEADACIMDRSKAGKASPLDGIMQGAVSSTFHLPMLRPLGVLLADGAVLDDHLPVPQLELARLLGEAFGPPQEFVGRHLVLRQRDHGRQYGMSSRQCARATLPAGRP